jgi:hypothetical protein
MAAHFDRDEIKKHLFKHRYFTVITPLNDPGTYLDRLRQHAHEDASKEPAIKREWVRETEKYEKQLKQLRSELTPLQLATEGTPYWTYANILIPEGDFEEPFTFPTETRFSGTWIIAPQGKGKTNLLHHLIHHDRSRRGTIVLMDSKGDLINNYRGFPGVVVIDYKTANINPLQLGSSNRSVEFLEYIFSQLLDTAMTGKQKSLFRSVLTVLLKVPNATIETFRKIMTTGWKPLNLEPYIKQCDPSTQDFFLAGKPPEFDSPQYAETKREVLWRLRLVLSNDYLRAIFTSEHTSIPFGQLLDSGKMIIIDNSKDDLGEEGAEFFGRFFVAIAWMAAVSRSKLPEDQKMPVFFYIDEAHTVIARDEKIATIITECRSQKIAMILAHQNLSQMTGDKVKAALADCAIRIANSDDDAAALAPRFGGVKPEALQLPTHSFAVVVRDKVRKAITVTVPWFDRNAFPPALKLPTPPPMSIRPARIDHLDDDLVTLSIDKKPDIEDF